MKTLNLFGFGIFWMLAITDAALIFKNLEQYRIFTKPLLIPVLLITILSTISRRKNPAFKTLLVLSFIFAAAGDIFLLKANANSPSFTWGLTCFLITHLLFTVYFFKIFPFSFSTSLGSVITFLVMAALSTWLIIFLKPYLNNLLIPVILYSFVLSLMLSAAANLLSSKAMGQTALDTFFPGALLFVLSDVMLAVNTFYFEEQVINAAIMLTYSGAMFYLAKGFLKHLHRRRSRSGKSKEMALS